MKLYTVAGTSTYKGRHSYRFANSLSRAQVLARNGHEHVELFALPTPMTKESAIEFLRKGSLIKQVAAQRVDKSQREETVLWKSMSPEMRANKQFEIWRFKAKEKFDFLED
jgi:hypothetical protein